MQCYSELAPPTAVTHSVALPLLSAKAANLVVAKTSLLQVFEVKTLLADPNASSIEEVEASPQDVAADTLDRSYFTSDISFQRVEHSAKLVLIAEYPLSGTVLSLKKVKPRRTKSGGAALLVAFRDAKFSFVEWDPEIYSLSTISIHFYEGEGLNCPWAGDYFHHRTFLTVDPGNRCAALKFGPRQLAILPFKQPDEDLAADGDADYGFNLDSADSAVKSPDLKRVPTKGIDTSDRLYNRSFVLPTTALEPTLTHPIHLAFLHEYREPTVGILFSTQFPAVSNLYERKDVLGYTVFTLDIEQRASTTILSVSGLPFDLFEVVPLTRPVGGALLVGSNQLVHVDQAGNTNALAVNEFAKQCSSFPMSDQSDAGIRLEGCTVEPFGDSGEVLIILKTGELVILTFKLDGRSVAGLEVNRVSAERGGNALAAAASCASVLARGKIFVGSEDSDSCVLTYTQKRPQLSRKRSIVELDGEEAELSIDEDELDEDDIYGNDDITAKERRRQSTGLPADPANITFRVTDILPNFAAIGDVTLGRHNHTRAPSNESHDPADNVQFVAPCGRGSHGGLALLNRAIDPILQKTMKLPGVRGVWPTHVSKGMPEGVAANSSSATDRARYSAMPQFDSYMIASFASENGLEESYLYAISAAGVDKIEKTDFDKNGGTVEVGTLASGTRVVQVLAGQLRCFNADFGLEQIWSPLDDIEGSNLKIVAASFSDPYLVLLNDDSSITLFETIEIGDVEEIDLPVSLTSNQWLSACLYKSAAFTQGKTLLFLLGSSGSLTIFEPPNLEKPVFVSDGLAYLPTTLSQDFTVRRAAAKETLTEIIVADIGDAISKWPYLVARTASDDLVLYRPFHYPERTSSEPFTKDLRFTKIFQPTLARFVDEPASEADTSGRATSLRRAANIGGYSTVFQSGTSPCFILKEASSAPRVINLRSRAVKGFGSFHTVSCSYGFAYLDSEDCIRISRLPPECRYGDIGWVSRKINLGQEVQNVAWYEHKGVYAISTSHKIDFKLPEDDYHYEWAHEETGFLPQLEQSTIKLVDPHTWTTIDAFELDFAEVVMSLKALKVEVSEISGQKKAQIVVGTAVLRGEDLAAKGNIYILDVVSVVPQPGHPETNRRFKLVAKEEVRGAVTAVSEIGTQGFMLFAHGQKVMVRGMKEDGLIPPTAFLDVQTYVTVAKTLPDSGLALLGDAIKGLWLVGYMEDPYKLQVFSKGPNRMEILAGELLPWQGSLYLLAVDGDSNIHVFQYDPEHPNSLNGQRLIHRSTFHTGHFPISLTRLPSTISSELLASAGEANGVGGMNGEPMDIDDSSHTPELVQQVLYTSQSGALGLITPVPEPAYRRLVAIQTYLSNQLDHPCALNPKGYRAVEHERFASRGMLDGTLLRRWSELNSQRRAEALAKIGVDEWVLRSDLEIIGGAGLGYL